MKKILFGTLGVFLLLGAGCMETNKINVNIAGVRTEIDMPQYVTADSDFTFDVKIKNTSEDTKYLRSIDLENKLFENVEIISQYPDRDAEYSITDWYIYEFNLPIEAEDELIVTFYAHANEESASNGLIDICINDDSSCITETSSLWIE